MEADLSSRKPQVFDLDPTVYPDTDDSIKYAEKLHGAVLTVPRDGSPASDLPPGEKPVVYDDDMNDDSDITSTLESAKQAED